MKDTQRQRYAEANNKRYTEANNERYTEANNERYKDENNKRNPAPPRVSKISTRQVADSQEEASHQLPAERGSLEAAVAAGAAGYNAVCTSNLICTTKDHNRGFSAKLQ